MKLPFEFEIEYAEKEKVKGWRFKSTRRPNTFAFVVTLSDATIEGLMAKVEDCLDLEYSDPQ